MPMANLSVLEVKMEGDQKAIFRFDFDNPDLYLVVFKYLPTGETFEAFFDVGSGSQPNAIERISQHPHNDGPALLNSFQANIFKAMKVENAGEQAQQTVRNTMVRQLENDFNVILNMLKKIY